MAEESEKQAQPAEAPPKPEAVAVDVAQLERELADARKRGEELYARLQYLQADFENYRKRTEREMGQFTVRANEVLMARLLSVLDDFDAAAAAVRGKAGKGLEMLRGNLLRALREFGLEEIPAKGAVFDPFVHECVQQANDPKAADGTVKEVVRKGYRLQTKVLRPAQVIVVKKVEQPVEKKEGEPNA